MVFSMHGSLKTGSYFFVCIKHIDRIDGRIKVERDFVDLCGFASISFMLLHGNQLHPTMRVEP